jgi:hypothetical protein
MPIPVLELLLMEKFGWTPNQIADIPEHKMKALFTVMNARSEAIELAKKLAEMTAKAKEKKNGKR